MTRKLRFRALLAQLHIEIETALWASLLAFVIFFCLEIAPGIPDNVANGERLRALKIAAENRLYCEKWGIKEGTQEHVQCTVDLQELRARIEQRRAEAISF